jgi:UDP-N-acetylglucosamine 1-carboxyvinyltransferase
MEGYIIRGGIPLAGEVMIDGAKNAALGILAGSLLTDDTVEIDNLPDVSDINLMLRAMELIGATVERLSSHSVKITSATVTSVNLENDYIKKMRGSYYFIGALLGKYKNAQVAFPGGCNIGSRPIDQHIKGFEALGAVISIMHGLVEASAVSLVGNHIYLDSPSVGATINIMLAAVLASGQTILENPAKEPHVVDVANFLNSMGANVKGAGTDVIRIRGVEKLHGSTYSIIPDQIEAGTFMLATAATKGDVIIRNVIPKHLEAITAKLVEIGAQVDEFDDSVRVFASKRLSHTQVKTLPYPGFPTDMQPQISTLLALSEGTSIVTETIFDNRFKYVDELTKMGACIKVESNTAIIEGVKGLSAAGLSAPDLRAGAALVIAGLAADGITTIEQIEYIERGYENFDEKLRSLGAQMAKMELTNEKEILKFKLSKVIV